MGFIFLFFFFVHFWVDAEKGVYLPPPHKIQHKALFTKHKQHIIQ